MKTVDNGQTIQGKNQKQKAWWRVRLSADILGSQILCPFSVDNSIKLISDCSRLQVDKIIFCIGIFCTT